MLVLVPLTDAVPLCVGTTAASVGSPTAFRSVGPRAGNNSGRQEVSIVLGVFCNAVYCATSL